MNASKQRERPIGVNRKGLTLSHAAAGHLRAAMEQMDLLMEARHVEAGLGSLESMLRHLRAVRRTVA